MGEGRWSWHYVGGRRSRNEVEEAIVGDRQPPVVVLGCAVETISRLIFAFGVVVLSFGGSEFDFRGVGKNPSAFLEIYRFVAAIGFLDIAPFE